MSQVLLTKRIEFAAAHRYVREDWDEARNRSVFGACFTPPGHGHNYMLEVTMSGEVDPRTGMVINLFDLKEILKAVLAEFDHKHLNLDTPYFRRRVPTTENIAAVLWARLKEHLTVGRLEKVRLFEDEDLCAEVWGTPDTARLVRRYHFSAAHRMAHVGGAPALHGHDYALYVTVEGPVDRETGMVVDLSLLDRTVEERVIRRFDNRDLDQDPELESQSGGESLSRLVSAILVKAFPEGRLSKVGLAETPRTYFECRA